MKDRLPMLWIEIEGNIPSKKNRYRFSKAGRMFSDTTFTKWHKQAMVQLTPYKMAGPIQKTNAVHIHFKFESLRAKDLSNCTESIMDLLVDCGIIEDDNFKVVPALNLTGEYIKGVSKTTIRIDYEDQSI